MSEVSTKADVRDMRDQLLGEMREGFDRTHARLDLLNGRVSKSEIEIGKHSERIKTLFARIVDRRHHERRQDEEAERRPITRRDVALIGTGLGMGLATLKFLAWISPALAALVR